MNFYVRPCHSKKLAGKKKFVGKFDFITGGWVGPDVLLGEWICLLTSLLTNESPPWENKDQITTISTDKDKSNKVKKVFFFFLIFLRNTTSENIGINISKIYLWYFLEWNTAKQSQPLLTCIYFWHWRGIAIRSNPEISPTLFITYHTVSLYQRKLGYGQL